MVPFNLGYSVREAGYHFKRNFGSSFGAVITIFLSLFIIGVFAIASIMVNNVVGDVESRITIQAFLADDADQAAVDSLEARVAGWEGVDSVTYKNKDEALAEYRQTMVSANAADAVEALDGRNPIPASLVIKLTDASMAESVANQIVSDDLFLTVCDTKATPSASVQYGAETVEKLLSLTNSIRVVAAALVILLVFVAFVFINNTIRLSIMARSDEIGIMRLVGASNSFIRGPFLMEGIIQALMGFVVSLGELEVFHRLVVPQLVASLKFLNFNIPEITYLWVYLMLLVLAVVIGVVGSLIAMNRYLKV